MKESNSDNLFCANNRRFGKVQSLILDMRPTLESGGKVGVEGCKDPSRILDRLKALGLDAKAEPMIAVQRLRVTYDTNNNEGKETKQTGYIFSCVSSRKMTYKFRADCLSDVECLMDLFNEKPEYKISSIDGFEPLPDVEVEMVSELHLEKLREVMRQVEDGHVMVQTVRPINEYTGLRDYDL